METKNEPPTEQTVERVVKAKKLGLSDAVAADYAGLTLDELEHRVASDPLLGKRMRLARVEGYVEQLKKIEESSAWPAREYVLKQFWGDYLAGDSANASKKDKAMFAAFQEVSTKMTPDQMARAPELLELGRLLDNQLKAARSVPPVDPCPEPSRPSSPTVSATPSSPAPSSPASEISAPSSDSPGT